MATAFLPGVRALPFRDDGGCGAAKRARDGDLLALLEESDARGWSSSVSERSLALRRRRGSSSTPLGCGWVASSSSAAATAEEHGCHREEEAAALGACAAAEEKVTADDPSRVAYCSTKRDLPAFDPPPMATPLLPLCSFVADLWKARTNGHVDNKPHRDEDLLPLSKEAEARGCSSEVLENSLSPRHRG